MVEMRATLMFGIGMAAGGMIALQSVLNAALGERVGNLGSVLILTLVSVAALIVIIAIFPETALWRNMPKLSEWYLYAGGVLGVAILAAPIFLVPRVGVTFTLVAIVMGQLAMALLVDHFGWFSSPTIQATPQRILGTLLVAAGAFLVGR